MIFGTPDTFAIEATVEPGPELPPMVGAAVAGRIRLFVAGHQLGKFDEPCCVLGPVGEHLLEVWNCHEFLWHDSLARLTPAEQFRFLDALFYAGTESLSPMPEQLHHVCLLTNVSEAFDDTKAFLLWVQSNEFSLLWQTGEDQIRHCNIQPADFQHSVQQFNAWVRNQEGRLNARA